MSHHHEIQRSIPERHFPAKGRGQGRGAWPTVNQDLLALPCGDENGISLANVEKGDMEFAIGQLQHGQPGQDGNGQWSPNQDRC